MLPIPRLEHRNIRALGDDNDHGLVSTDSGKIALQLETEEARLRTDNVVLTRAVIERPAEYVRPDLLFGDLVDVPGERAFTDVQEEIFQAGGLLESGSRDDALG